MPIFDFSSKSLYSRGAALRRDAIYLSLKDRKLDRQSVLHSRFIAIIGEEWGPLEDLPWATAGMCVARKPAQKLVAVSPDGKVFTSVSGKRTHEQISPKPLDLRYCGAIAGYAYACGMNRQVYRRTAEAEWLAMHATESKKGEVAGFEAIDGFDEKEIYAVGWEGEIWQLVKKKWVERESPVNVILTGVECAGDGVVYVCGQNGTLLSGRNDEWEVLEQNNLEDDLWDLCWFNKKLYVASMSYLYQLEGTELVPVEFGKDAPDSCYKLTEADGVLWSVGQEDLFSYDGKTWTRWD
jgi:hypothetical protein